MTARTAQQAASAGAWPAAHHRLRRSRLPTLSQLPVRHPADQCSEARTSAAVAAAISYQATHCRICIIKHDSYKTYNKAGFYSSTVHERASPRQELPSDLARRQQQHYRRPRSQSWPASCRRWSRCKPRRRRASTPTSCWPAGTHVRWQQSLHGQQQCRKQTRSALAHIGSTVCLMWAHGLPFVLTHSGCLWQAHCADTLQCTGGCGCEHCCSTGEATQCQWTAASPSAPSLGVAV